MLATLTFAEQQRASLSISQLCGILPCARLYSRAARVNLSLASSQSSVDLTKVSNLGYLDRINPIHHSPCLGDSSLFFFQRLFRSLFIHSPLSTLIKKINHLLFQLRSHSFSPS